MTNKSPLLFFVCLMISAALMAQNVGISNNIFTPRSYLHVHQPLATGNLLQLTNSTSGNATNAVGLVFSVNTNEWTMRNYQAGNLIFQTGNGNMRFFTNNTERMIILSSGNVGIGDLTPLALFTVGNGDLFRVESTGHVRTINATVGAPAYSFTGSTNTGMWAPAASNIAFSTAGIQRVRIDNNGSVGIGTATPFTSSLGGANVQRLNVISPATPANSSMTEFINSSSMGLALVGYITSGTNNWAAVEAGTYGGGFAFRGIHLPNLGIGFHGTGFGVYGASNSYDGIGTYGSSPAEIFWGDLGAAGYFDWDVIAGDYWNFSDRRLKKDIVEYNGALNEVMKLQVYNFSYNTDIGLNTNDRMRYGYIAQEIEEVFPGIVKEKNVFSYTDANDEFSQKSNLIGQFKVVNYIELIPILTQAIQEQQQIIESLEQRIERLEQLLLEKQ